MIVFMLSTYVSGTLMELQKLQGRIKELEKENNELRHRLNATYDFIHHQGNPDYYKKQQDWDGVTRETYTTGNTERLDRLTRKFGIDEYPLE